MFVLILINHDAIHLQNKIRMQKPWNLLSFFLLMNTFPCYGLDCYKGILKDYIIVHDCGSCVRVFTPLNEQPEKRYCLELKVVEECKNDAPVVIELTKLSKKSIRLTDILFF